MFRHDNESLVQKFPLKVFSLPTEAVLHPSLLFDGDKVYFVSTTSDEQGAGIFLCEVNPFTGEKLTESVCINRGCGGRYPEGPHLYKWFGKYYLCWRKAARNMYIWRQCKEQIVLWSL